MPSLIFSFITRYPTYLRTLLAGGIFLAGLTASTVVAQQSAILDQVVTAAEETRGLQLYSVVGLMNGRQRIPRDQFDTAIREHASNWVASLQRKPVRGIQLDPMGTLFIAAGQDELAKRQFAARLGVRDLSVADRAYTLLLAISAFGAKASDTARMQTALTYLQRLDALPASEVGIQFLGHVRIARAYYMNGDGSHVVSHLTKAFSLVPTIPFEQRRWGWDGGISESFVLLADVLSGRTNGRTQIDSIGAWLLTHAHASPALIAKDSVYITMSRGNTRVFKTTLQLVSHLGRQAPAITAHYWWNTTPPVPANSNHSAATSKMLNDGIIRVMMYGHFGCQGCLATLPKFDHMRETTPSTIEMWYVTMGDGYWGATPCTPDEEAQHLRHYYTIRKKYKLLIALWVGGRITDIDGGTGQEGSPSFAAYPIQGFPWFIVTDGRGIVRHISFGFSETLLKNVVTYLVAESEQSSSSAAH